MAKLIVEENLKSKHPDSFKILKSHGYKLLDNEDNEEHYANQGNFTVKINSKGNWLHYNQLDPNRDTRGKSHSDLKVHLDKLHN